MSADTGEVRLTYFKGRGRAETTRWMLAAVGIEWEEISLALPEDLAALRASGRLPLGQIPLLEIDGLGLSQTGAMVRYLARKGDLYGDDAVDAAWCDMIFGTVADFAEPALKAAFQPDAATMRASLEAPLAKFAPPLEARVAGNAGHVAGGRRSFGDIVLAETLTAYDERMPGCLAAYPALADLQARVVAEPGIAAYLASDRRWVTPGAQYVVDVARVLQRALPPHMPDPERFVV